MLQTMETTQSVPQISIDCTWWMEFFKKKNYFYQLIENNQQIQTSKQHRKHRAHRRYLAIKRRKVGYSRTRSSDTRFKISVETPSNVARQRLHYLKSVLQNGIHVTSEEYNFASKYNALNSFLLKEKHKIKHQCQNQRKLLLREVRRDNVSMTKSLKQMKRVQAHFIRALEKCQCYSSNYMRRMNKVLKRYILLLKDSAPHLNVLMRERRQQNLFFNHHGKCRRSCQKRRKKYPMLQKHRSVFMADAELYQMGLQRWQACKMQNFNNSLHPDWLWFKNDLYKNRLSPSVLRLRKLRKLLIQALFPIFAAKTQITDLTDSSVSLKYIFKKTLGITLPNPVDLHKALLRRRLINKHNLQENFLVWDKQLFYHKVEMLNQKLRLKPKEKNSYIYFNYCFSRQTIRKLEERCHISRIR